MSSDRQTPEHVAEGLTSLTVLTWTGQPKYLHYNNACAPLRDGPTQASFMHVQMNPKPWTICSGRRLGCEGLKGLGFRRLSVEARFGWPGWVSKQREHAAWGASRTSARPRLTYIYLKPSSPRTLTYNPKPQISVLSKPGPHKYVE